MKISLKQRLHVFPKLRRRFSSVKWALLLITTAMFFLSAASTSCPSGALSVVPLIGSSVNSNPNGGQLTQSSSPLAPLKTTSGGSNPLSLPTLPVIKVDGGSASKGQDATPAPSSNGKKGNNGGKKGKKGKGG
jgi:hypothetical protein